MKRTLILAASSALLVLATPVMASSYEKGCFTEKGKWMELDAVRAKLTEMGYDVRKIETDDGCYEAYALDKEGRRVEIYMNPVTGDIVKTKPKS